MRPELLPACTSEPIAMANLAAQIGLLRENCERADHPGCAASLVDALLTRYSVTADQTDLACAEALADRLPGRAPDSPDAWLAIASLRATRHDFAAAAHALDRASANGAPPPAVSQQRADLLEARGQVRAALEFRRAGHAAAPSAAGLSRIACCHLALGAHAQAQAAFSAALRAYRSVSPLPLSAMLFNWGHAWAHGGDRRRAEQSYQAVLDYLPGHVRARRALEPR